MGWNPYTDHKNRAYSGFLSSLFPEQTRTIPRILAWSIVFLLDLIGILGGAFCLGLLSGEWNYKVTTALLLVTIVGVFWLQGKIWYGFANYLQKRKKLDGL